MADKVIVIDCTDCWFSKRMNGSSEDSPAEVVIRHGRRHGHQLNVTSLDPSESDSNVANRQNGNPDDEESNR